MGYRRPVRYPVADEVDVEDDYPVYNSGSSGAAGIFMIFLVIVVLGWLITEAENGRINTGGIIQPVIATAPVYSPPNPVVVNPVVEPVVTYETVPSQQVVARTNVTADEVNLRTGPGFEYESNFILGRNNTVAILNQSHIGINGESWVKVGIETPQGPVTGWISRRYVAY